LNQRRTELVLLYRGGSSSSDKGVAYPVVLRNKGAGHFWDIELRALHDGVETDRKPVPRASRIRGTPVEADFVPARDLVSRFVDLPLRQFREFVQKAVADLDRLPTLLAAEGDDPIRMRLELKVAIEPGVLEEWTAEMQRLERLYGVGD
jgi:hypothetical protein